MNCEEYELSISRMVDGELSADDSRAVFSHLASCGTCRAFYRQLQSLGASLDIIAGNVEIPGEIRRRRLSNEGLRSWWSGRVPLRAPIFAVLLLALVISLYFSVSNALQVRQPEIVYVTQLPPITVTAEAVPIHFMKRGVKQ